MADILDCDPWPTGGEHNPFAGMTLDEAEESEIGRIPWLANGRWVGIAVPVAILELVVIIAMLRF